MKLWDLLAESPIFAHLGKDGLSQWAAAGEFHQYRNGEWIAHYGDVWPYLFIIRAGEVQAVKESCEGRSLVLAAFCEGQIFWGLAFFIEGAPMPAALTASRDCELFVWPRERVLPLLLQDGRLAWALSCLMIQRVQLASGIVEKLAFQQVGGRLAGVLVELSGEEAQGPIARSLTLDEMAARIGSTREVVSRFLHRFSDQGLIEISRTEFTIKDRKGLQDLAQQTKG